MFNRTVVQEALRRSLAFDNRNAISPIEAPEIQSTVISQLIHDIFGGEILKTHKRKNWHFYNRIDGERIDFAASELGKSPEENSFEDISSTPDETHNYFEQEDYSTFFIRFVTAFEEIVGLNKCQSGYTT
jgi:hypothetical protein